MIYTSTISTPAGTAEKSIPDVTLKITSGLIWLLEVDFPPGGCGLLHVQVFDGSYQVLPATPGESLHGDAVVMKFDDLYFKEAAPFELMIRTWNEDDTWPHATQVRIGVASTRAEMSRYMPAFAWEDFEKLMAEMLVSQQALRQSQLEAAVKEIGG